MPHLSKYDRPFAASIKLVEAVDELLRASEALDVDEHGTVKTVAVVITAGTKDRLIRLCRSANKELHP